MNPSDLVNTFKGIQAIGAVLAVAGSFIAVIGYLGVWYYQIEVDKIKDARVEGVTKSVGNLLDEMHTGEAAFTLYLDWDILGSSAIPVWYSERGSGVSLAFLKEGKPVLIMRSHEFNRRSSIKGKVTAQGFLDIYSIHAEAPGSLKLLSEAQSIQIKYPGIPDNTKLTHGEIDGKINNRISLRFNVPEQTIFNETILLKDLKDFSSRFQMARPEK